MARKGCCADNSRDTAGWPYYAKLMNCRFHVNVSTIMCLFSMYCSDNIACASIEKLQSQKRKKY